MLDEDTAVYGIYTSRAAAENGVSRLIDTGFSNEDISVLAADKSTAQEFSAEKNTKAPEGATTGATTGGAIGGVLGLLAGIGAIAIPGVGPFIAAGPIMGALAGIGAGATAGGIVGALVGMGIPEYEAKRYENQVREGGILVSVYCETPDMVRTAKEILTKSDARDVSSAVEEDVVRRAS